MYEFEYHRPQTVNEAAALLADREEARALAGGMTLIPTMKLRLAQPTDLVDLGAIDGLDRVERHDDVVEVGALARHADVAANTAMTGSIPALARLTGAIGDPQVRNCGSLGGSIANADPAADYPAALLALDATIVTDRREIRADEFFTGLFETSLERGELIVAVRFRTPDTAHYVKFRNPASGYAIAGVFVAKFPGQVRVAVTGAGPCAFRVPDMESALQARFSPAALNGISVDAGNFANDLHADAAYRAHLVGVLARRAVEKAGG